MLKKLLKKILKPKQVLEEDNFSNIQKNIKFLIDVKLQNGRIWSHLLLQKKNIKSLHEAEFKVFSQWGDDGIIQYLVNYLDIENKTFVEFGVEDYLESNTRFLLMNDNWAGLVMDGSEINIAKIKKNEIYWKHDLIAKFAFITAENINRLIGEEGIKGQIGLLHIDIDGNDYWIWKALEVVEPIIIVVEYNSKFGSEKAITIPYKEDFVWTKAHYSNLYFGASILAFCDLAQEKGYSFVGSNSAGNNAYFVKNEFLKGLTPLSAKEGYVESKFRQSRDENGNLNFLNPEQQINILKGLPIYNTRSKKNEII